MNNRMTKIERGARYGQPDYLVFDGLLYYKKQMNLHELEGDTFTTVVPHEYYNDDDDDDDPDPTEAGPDLVVFNSAVYQRSLISDPAYIEDNILRTVEATIRRSAYPQQARNSSTSAAQGLSFQHPQARPATTPQANYPAPPQPQSGQVWTIAPPQSQIVMPPRARTTNKKTLQLLFDLPAHQRAGVQIIRPSQFNPPIALQPGQPKRRSRWADAHTRYLYELMELAMLLLNRPLEHGDFPAITEALHRQFRGTSTGNGPYLERGYNTVHTYATRKQPYDDLLRRVLPDMVGNRPAWTPRNHQ